MAHADYNCCAVCDEKQDYSNDAQTKAEICTFCMKAFRSAGLSILDVEELKNWLKTEKPEKVITVLLTAGYCSCHYQNEVDDLVKAIDMEKVLSYR